MSLDRTNGTCTRQSARAKFMSYCAADRSRGEQGLLIPFHQLLGLSIGISIGWNRFLGPSVSHSRQLRTGADPLTRHASGSVPSRGIGSQCANARINRPTGRRYTSVHQAHIALGDLSFVKPAGGECCVIMPVNRPQYKAVVDQHK